MELNIERPSTSEVEKHLNNWDNNDKYVLHDLSLNELFKTVYPNNTDIKDILIKATVLNNFYSTNIFDIYTVSLRILSLNIDERLAKGDEKLVDELSVVVIQNNEKHFYSFASKYCSHHYPDLYPIYDSYVEKILCYFQKKDNFSSFSRKDLRSYSTFKRVIINFKKFYDIDQYNLKDIDRYLWLLGKEKLKKDTKS
ncbi:MAG: hypothetical protein WBO70_02395 [Erysipelotrichaceae bacterium]